jgi:O-antigen biosynthesis protein
MTKKNQRTPNRRAQNLTSIIIPVFNKAEYTQRCLAALEKNTPAHAYELIVVDNASSDHTREVLRAFSGPKQIVVNRENKGFVEACNQGAAKARGRFLLFLNNDTEVQPGWLTALLAEMRSHPQTGAAGAKLVYPGGKLQEAGGIIFSDGNGWNFGHGGDPGDPRYNQRCEVDFCSGACLMVRAALFKRLRGFDRRYAPAYYEDADLCFGIRALGYSVIYVPQSEVIHYEGMTAGTQLTAGLKKFQAINQPKFSAKWEQELLYHSESPAVSGRPPETADRQQLHAALKHLRTAPPADINILVVDPTLPFYDKQAGSLRLFNIIKLFLAAGCNITYVARDGVPEDPYRAALEALGIEVHIGNPDMLLGTGLQGGVEFWDLRQLLARNFFHYAWLSFYQTAEQFLPVIRRYSPHTQIVLDTVDIHFIRELRHAELLGSKARALDAAETRRRELDIYRQADMVVNVTPDDTRVLVEGGLSAARMRIIPIIYPVADQVPAFDQRRDIVFVANFNHLPNIDAVKFFCSEVFPAVRKALPGIKFFVVGNNPPQEIKKLAGESVSVTGYVPNLDGYLNRCRVSVAPLRFGAGMKGKIVEALSYGLPVVTTKIGAEGMGLKDGENIIIRDRSAELAAQVIRLCTDKALWEKLSAGGQAHVRKHFTPQSVAKTLKAFFRKSKGQEKAELEFYHRRLRWEALYRAKNAGLVKGNSGQRQNLYLVQQIANSKGYRVLQGYYRLRDFLLPPGSLRRSALKGLSRFLFRFLSGRQLKSAVAKRK